MPAHPDAFRALAARLVKATTQEERDELLDRWLDYLCRATEWDAEMWGFDPDRWLEKERNLMQERAARDAAREATRTAPQRTESPTGDPE